ncbi:hypothetical protein [uncultured Fusobacterium sp.]|uniref:hypothetical protein n=1 Tax=uncultured Fusobacterium sp. TaxID=159267 RepID=UPI0028045B16|nr:hypothetical protein [uncultured Fusobacterium sp.]
MKSFFKYSLLIIVLLFTSCGRVTEQEARKALSEHLKTRYNEEFNIGLIGRRSDDRDTWYQAKIYPKKYEGTTREYDEYYHRNGNVNIKKGIFGESIDYVGDTYRIVLMNESANKFYLPKLKELFGENVLPVLDINIAELSIYPEFLTEMKERMKAGGHPQIKGGIYIFGRVESDEDREWYRKQIYEFVQFMKETGTFEYVDIEFIISDDRIFSDEFYTNEKLQSEMKEYGNYIDSKGRKNILNKVNKSYEITNKNRVLERINNLNKSNIDSEFYGIYWLVTKIYSPKYIESKGWKDEKIKQYNKVSDIEFSVEGYNE